MPTLSPQVTDAIRQYAPNVARVIGTVATGNVGVGMAAGAAVDAIARAIDVRPAPSPKITVERIQSKVIAAVEGKDNSMGPVELEHRLKDVDPEIVPLLLAHEVQMTKLGNESVEKTRAHFGAWNWGQFFTGLGNFILCGGVIYAIMLKHVDVSDPIVAGIVGLIAGHVLSWVGGMNNYHYGSSAGSAQKSEAIQQRLASTSK